MYKVSSQNLFLVELTYTGLTNNLIIAAKTIKNLAQKANFLKRHIPIRVCLTCPWLKL